MRGYAVFIILVLAVSGCASLPSEFYSLSDGVRVDLGRVLETIGENRVIFIGEFHGTASTHLLQFEVVRRLHEKGRSVIVALEAFPASRQDILDRWVEGTLTPDDFERMYQGIWSIPYDFYEDLFVFARSRGIPLIGINADDGLIRTVSAKGLSSVSPDVLREVKFSSCADTPGYGRVLDLKQYHKDEYPHLCDGQRLRDAVMAYHISCTVEKGHATVVVILGVAHAAKVAVPALLMRHREVAFSVLLPEDVSGVIGRTPDSEIADYIWGLPGL